MELQFAGDLTSLFRVCCCLEVEKWQNWSQLFEVVYQLLVDFVNVLAQNLLGALTLLEKIVTLS